MFDDRGVGGAANQEATWWRNRRPNPSALGPSVARSVGCLSNDQAPEPRPDAISTAAVVEGGGVAGCAERPYRQAGRVSRAHHRQFAREWLFPFVPVRAKLTCSYGSVLSLGWSAAQIAAMVDTLLFGVLLSETLRYWCVCSLFRCGLDGRRTGRGSHGLVRARQPTRAYVFILPFPPLGDAVAGFATVQSSS